MAKIKLGLFVKDKVTGLMGVAENRATFLYGCDRYFVQPQVDKDGKVPTGMMIDEPQLQQLNHIPSAMVPMPEPEQIIQLGSSVYDPITGRKGIATGRAVYLNGCSRIFVEPKHKLLTIDAKGWWTEEQQLVIKKKVISQPKEYRTGGPARSCSKY